MSLAALCPHPLVQLSHSVCALGAVGAISPTYSHLLLQHALSLLPEAWRGCDYYYFLKRMDSHHIPSLSDVLGDDRYLLGVQRLGGSGMHPLQTGWRWVAVALDEEGVEVTTGLHLDPPRVCSVERSRNLKYNRKAAPLSVLLFIL